jgi:hypothetical protein
MMRPRARPSERMTLSAVAAVLMLPALLSGPAAGVTQRHCPTKPHTGRHNEKRASRCWCAESACHVSKVVGVASASNSAAQDPPGAHHSTFAGEGQRLVLCYAANVV